MVFDSSSMLSFISCISPWVFIMVIFSPLVFLGIISSTLFKGPNPKNFISGYMVPKA